MPLFKTILPTGGLIGVWQLTETSGELLSFFTKEELNDPAFAQYTFEKRKVEWLTTRILIRKLIGPGFTISYSGTGKPILNHSLYKNISISHSREFVAVFLHESLSIGIDIENSSRNYNAVEKRYLSDGELIWVNQNPLLQCLYWCAKEAVFKMVSENGIEFRKQILITPFHPGHENQFQAKFISGHKEFMFKLEFQTFGDACLVWVTD